MQRLIAAIALASAALAVPAAARAGEAVVVWSRQSCEMALVEKPGGHFGVILRLTDNRLEIGDKLEGDFESIDAIRNMKNLESGEDIMMRGVRYSTSRKYVLQVMPKWCKAPKGSRCADAQPAPAAAHDPRRWQEDGGESPAHSRQGKQTHRHRWSRMPTRAAGARRSTGADRGQNIHGVIADQLEQSRCPRRIENRRRGGPSLARRYRQPSPYHPGEQDNRLNGISRQIELPVSSVADVSPSDRRSHAGRRERKGHDGDRVTKYAYGMPCRWSCQPTARSPGSLSGLRLSGPRRDPAAVESARDQIDLGVSWRPNSRRHPAGRRGRRRPYEFARSTRSCAKVPSNGFEADRGMFTSAFSRIRARPWCFACLSSARRRPGSM